MVRFLRDVKGDGIDFMFNKGEEYEHVEPTTEGYEDFIFVRQPDSPDNDDWYCKIPRKEEGIIYEFAK